MINTTEVISQYPIKQAATDNSENEQYFDTTKNTIERFGDNNGFFDVVVKPMLQIGHEGELCKWLQDMNIIRSSMLCPHEECKSRALVWSQSRGIDKYSWNCQDCKKKQSIKDSSFFWEVKADFKVCLQVMLAWCQSLDIDRVVPLLNTKRHLVKKIYDKLCNAAEEYINKHLHEWMLGGDQLVVIVDEYPGGCMTADSALMPPPKKRNNNHHNILCLAEIKESPPRMWLHAIEAHPEPIKSKKDQPKKKCPTVEEAQKEILKMVRPGSVLIANERSRSCNYEALKELSQYRVFSIEDIKKYDLSGTNQLLYDFETIWQTALEVCDEVQDVSKSIGMKYIYEFLWKRKFENSPSIFESMLTCIAGQYNFH